LLPKCWRSEDSRVRNVVHFSCFWLLVYQVYQLTSNRKHLLDNLTNSCIAPQWRAEDILRTKFRLSLVLSAAGEEKGASERRQEIKASIESLRPKEPPSDHEPYTDEDDMKLLDFGVVIFHGRTAGIWSDGRHW
jgi:hypothetical protein